MKPQITIAGIFTAVFRSPCINSLRVLPCQHFVNALGAAAIDVAFAVVVGRFDKTVRGFPI